jgi:hypothetical protein
MITKLYLAVACALSISLNLNAQCNDVTLSSQADVNSFQTTYGGCTVISGTLTIRGNDISNLSPLSQITSVGALYVTDCSQLWDLSWLYNITNISGSNPESIRIARNASLRSIDGLEGITSVPGKILVQDNPALPNIDGFHSITTMSGQGANIYINGNIALENIDGFRSLKTLSGGSIGGVISIAYNPALKNINGLSSITRVEGADAMVEILHNEALVNLDGLSSLTQIATGSSSKHAQLKITENFALTNGCGAYKLLSANDPNLDVTISDNGSVTEESIIAGGPCGTIGCNGDITLSSQAEVDAFPSSHGCSVINGVLNIQGADITNLDSLYKITKATTVSVHNNHQLTNIAGLSNLTEVDEITLSSNSVLADLTPLSSLHTVHGLLNIGFNSNMRSLHGLENIKSVNELRITGQTLDDLTGLSGLTSVIGSLAMEANSISTLNGLNHITSVGDQLLIKSDSTLTSLDGLSGVTTIGKMEISYTRRLQTIGMHSLQKVGEINIYQNMALVNLDGLSSLTTIGALDISDNPNLQSIRGLGSVNTSSAGISLYKNPQLASLAGLENLSVIPGGLIISDNDAMANLSGLGATTIGVLVVMGNANLQSFDGAGSLTRISNTNCGCPGAGLKISDNALLANINALSNLNFIGSTLEISNNPKLQNIDALSAVTSVGLNRDFGDVSIAISGNTMLTSIQGLRNVPGVAGGVSITDNDALVNLDGLNKLTQIGGFGLQISDNASLTDIDGLSKVTHASGGINVSKNAVLTNLDGFASLQSITGVKNITAVLHISDNPMLANVDSLGKLSSISGVTNSLVVTNNPNLTNGCGFYTVLHSPNLQTTFSGNGPGVTKDEILANGPCGGVYPQTCQGDVTLTSQADVDAFRSGRGCTIISGELAIIGFVGDGDITNLDSLSSLTKVGSISIAYNQRLKNINGLSNITSIGTNSNNNKESSIIVEGNPMLTSLSGFSGLSGAIGGVYINDNDALTSLDGLQHINKIGGYGLQLNDNDVLVNTSALSKVTMINLEAQIANNSLLTNLNGFRSLAEISIVRGGGVTLEISGNPMLENVDSLSNFVSLRGPHSALTVTNNPKLTKGCGLYPVLNDFATNCPDCPVTFDFSGSGVTREEILAGGPCTNPTESKTCDGAISLTSQADVDAFPASHGCTTIKGLLSISGNDITDLTPLSIIDSVGSLYITNNANLQSLHGLEGIIAVGHVCPCIYPGLTIDNNAKLSNIDGLSGIASIGGLVKITNNAVLTNINGLSHLTRLGDGVDYAEQSIVIENNPMLSTLAGFSNVSGTVGQIDINNNDALTNLNGLQNITSIAGYGLSLMGNSSLTDISALSRVTDVGGAVHISDNAMLPNLNGLQSLRAVNIVRGSSVALVVTGNMKLTNVDSLSSFTELRGPSMTVNFSDNPDLTKGCGLFPLLNDFAVNCPDCQVTYNFSGSGITKEGILAGGRCQPSAPTTCDGNITLSSQAAVDAFSSTYGCSIVNGVLNINGSDITRLDSLSMITHVGVLFIGNNTVLQDLDGLNNLTTIGGGHCQCPAAGMYITGNPQLMNVDGLSSLVSIDKELSIKGNSSLQNINGLSSLTTIGSNPELHYLSMEIDNNAALTTIRGLRNLESISGRTSVSNNNALLAFDGFQKIKSIDGFAIYGNASMANLNGLASLEHIYASPGTGTATFVLSDNASLTNVDSLSNLVDILGPDRRLFITNNPNLTRGCGLYDLLRIEFCADCNGTLTMSNNGPGFTRDEIIAGGPCDGNDDVSPTAPTNLMFADVTENSMTVSFTKGVRADGYIILMRAFESSLPDDGPVTNHFYQVGNTIGCCSIVVGNGMDTTHYISYQEPDVDYYFDIIPWTSVDIGIHYFTDLALSGHQRTLPPSQPYPNPFMEELTIPVTVTEANVTVRISITDQLGRSVSEITQTVQTPGKHEIRWNRADHQGNRVMNGVYTYSINTPHNSVKGLVMAK